MKQLDDIQVRNAMKRQGVIKFLLASVATLTAVGSVQPALTQHPITSPSEPEQSTQQPITSPSEPEQSTQHPITSPSEPEQSTQPPITIPSIPEQSSYKAPTKIDIQYECFNDDAKGKTSTIVHTARGPIELVSWKSTFFGPQWSPLRRCEVVSERFQTLSNTKQLKFISTGRLNNYNVICASQVFGECMQDGLLITLETQDNPNQVLREMFNYNAPITRGPLVIDLEQLLQERAPMTDLESTAQPAQDLQLD